MMWMWMLACASKPTPGPTEPPVQQDPAQSTRGGHTQKGSAPVDVVHQAVDGGSQLQLTFTADATDVDVRLWTTGALTLDAERHPDGAGLALDSVAAGAVHALQLRHDGDGLLAMRVAGVWSGVAGEEVRSFTIGDPPAPRVPTTTIDGRTYKGWQAEPASPTPPAPAEQPDE